MPTPLQQKHIASSLFAWWMEEFPEEIPTIFPGLELDTNSLSEWVEIGFDSWTPAVQRKSQAELLETAITVHCFTKSSNEPAQIQEIAQQAKSLLTHAVIPIADYDDSETPLVGYLLLWEPEARTLTRTHRASLQLNLHHQVVTVRGLAQRVDA